MEATAARILALLPQTQCTRCGYADCSAYAQAIAQDGAAINKCPPGGAKGIERLAALTGKPVAVLDPVNGQESPRSVAFIDEAWCIGCTLCIEACPTDAILGSNKLMHTVIEACCTGCELCIPVCPVDCIELENVSGQLTGWTAWSAELADQAHKRYEIKSYRRNLHKGSRAKTLEENEMASVLGLPGQTEPFVAPTAEKKQALIATALRRAREDHHGAKKTNLVPPSDSTGPSGA